jgi:hypothetical protein
MFPVFLPGAQASTTLSGKLANIAQTIDTELRMAKASG